MIVVWRRGGQNFSFYRPSTDFVLGVRGGGKSSLLEHQAQNYLKRGQARAGGENLAWLRSPWANIDDRTPDYEKRILLIHGDNTSVSAPHDTKNISKVNLRDARAVKGWGDPFSLPLPLRFESVDSSILSSVFSMLYTNGIIDLIGCPHKTPTKE